jgi:hypothetical protein
LDAERLLRLRAQERAALLERAGTLLQGDPRISAAWLFGSEARGSADALSDLDLWTVVDDAQVDALAAERFAYVRRIGIVLHCYDGPQNAPAGGAYLMALYAGKAGPIQVDWYWQPRARAAIPTTAQLLFNRDGVPIADPGAGPLEPAWPPDAAERRERAARCSSFFWVMANITAKNIARGLRWSAIGQIDMLRRQLWEAEWLLGLRADHHLWRDSARRAAPPLDPVTQLALLRTICVEMENLQPLLVGAEAAVSSEAIAAIRDFFALVDSLLPDQR